MGRLFGTDGARGVANTELTCELAMSIGRAAAAVLTDKDKKHPTFLIGKDTRVSSDMLESALTAGLCSVGANVIQVGVVPTPAVAFLVGEYQADAGVMISASHNPYEFNGIKLFSGTGYKLPDEVEEKIEAIVLDHAEDPVCMPGSGVGSVKRDDEAAKIYIEHVKKTAACSFNGLKIAFDCANGSASRTAYQIFSGLGVDCRMLHDQPDGININTDCGSTHMERLIAYVKENGMDAGLAFDGDADRCLAVDENGAEVDGDKIMTICSRNMKEKGKLSGNTVVGTVMSNLGFRKACEKNGICFEATKVGDRYVLEQMLEKGYKIGGEQSGHVIFLDFATTGDGELTAVQLLSVMKEQGKKLSELGAMMDKYPQILVNVKVASDGKERFFTNKRVQKAVKDAEAEMSENGRVLIRPSGTEPLLRVMVEGKDMAQIEALANRTADVIREELG